MQKIYYSISEVCQLVDEEQHILRYWEKEFPQLKPKKNRGGNRIYTEKDVFLINSIKNLLRVEKIPLKNAKVKLSEITYKSNDELFSEKLTDKTVINKSLTEMEKVPEDLTVNRQVLSKSDAEELLSILRKFSKVLNQNN